MRSDKHVLKVRIYGADYSIRGQADTDYIKTVADFVDAKMVEVDRTVRVDSALKVAILASLNIADQLFHERSEKDTLRTELEDKIRQLNDLIDHRLSERSVAE